MTRGGRWLSAPLAPGRADITSHGLRCTYGRVPPAYCTYRRHRAAFPRCSTHFTCAVRVPAPGAPYVARIVAPQAQGTWACSPSSMVDVPVSATPQSPPLCLLRLAPLTLGTWLRSIAWRSDRAAQRPMGGYGLGTSLGQSRLGQSRRWPSQVHFLYRTYTPIVLLAARRLPTTSTLRSALLHRGSTTHAFACALVDNVP